jgi:hypothetical protein
MKKTFPHTTALPGALPLSAVTAELRKLLAFLSTTLKLTPAQLATALKANFPALTQAITNLPTVTDGWEQIPGIDGLTRFDGTPVSSVPQLRDYFKDDLIPAVASQQKNFQSLDELDRAAAADHRGRGDPVRGRRRSSPPRIRSRPFRTSGRTSAPT